MSKRPAPFWVDDWENDEWVQRAQDRHDWERLGVYQELLWRCFKYGTIDSDEHILALSLHLRPCRFNRLWDDGQATGLRWKFVGEKTGVVGGEPGERLYNAKMRRARGAQDAFLDHKPKLNSVQFEYGARKPARRHRCTRLRLQEETRKRELLQQARKAQASVPPSSPRDPEEAACTTVEEMNALWESRLRLVNGD